MFKNRFFYSVIVVALLAIAVLLAYQTVSTARVAAASQQRPVMGAAVDPTNTCPFTPEELRSIHPVWVKEIGQWVMYSNHGPVGVDGGMEAVRSCPPLK
jgi:hypothetical protein